MAQTTRNHPRAALSDLLRDYEIPDEEGVLAFLERYPDVVPLLPEIRRNIRRYFGDDPVQLDVFYDPEWEDIEEQEPELFATIQTKSGDALMRLKRFDLEWWIEKLKQTDAPLVVSFHHVRRD